MQLTNKLNDILEQSIMDACLTGDESDEQRDRQSNGDHLPPLSLLSVKRKNDERDELNNESNDVPRKLYFASL